MPFSKEFLKNPKGFADLYALLPSLSKQNKSELKAKPVSADLTVYQVEGGNRILFACINKHPTQSNLYEVAFSTAQPTSDWFPVYWLPWDENQVYRITLKRSKKLSIFDREERVVSPNIFFTAALNGCLVHVDGDPWAPTVYHLNATSHPVDKGPPQYTHTEWDFLMKVHHMERQAAAAQMRYPKGRSHYQPGSVNALQYTPHNISERAAIEQHTKAMQKFGTTYKETTPINNGIVFGVRNDSTGLWAFYYQSLTHYLYTKNDVRFDEWAVNRCVRFWPGDDISKPIPIQVVGDDDGGESD